MDPAKEIELCESVASMSASLLALNDKVDIQTRILDDHTKADAANFEKLSEKLDALVAKDNQAIGAAKTRSFIWSMLAGGGAVAAWEFLKRMFAPS